MACSEVSIQTILGTECIGDSLPKIMGNFNALGNATCDLITSVDEISAAVASSSIPVIKTLLASYLPLTGGTLSSNSAAVPTLTITQAGNALALRVNDSNNSDATPFAIDTFGHVLVSTPAAKNGYDIDTSLNVNSPFLATLSAQGNDSGLYIKSINGIPFYVEDESGDQNPFIIDKSGKVGIGTKTPNSMLTVKGDISASGSIKGSIATTGNIVTTGYVSANLAAPGVQLIVTNSKGEGYYNLPGGTTIQWGYFTIKEADTGNDDYVPITFPLAFTAMNCVVASVSPSFNTKVVGTGDSDNAWIIVDQITNVGFQARIVYGGDKITRNGSYVAIGYIAP